MREGEGEFCKIKKIPQLSPVQKGKFYINNTNSEDEKKKEERCERWRGRVDRTVAFANTN